MICTVTPISNSKQIENYYTRDDYYSRDAKREDYWQGKLSKNVGLSQKRVDKKHFAALIQMTDKRKNEGQKPTLGVDITFSCPKSVSILQAVSPEYREIVNRCIAEVTDEMIALIERKFIRTRRGYGGKSLEYTQKILAAGINHEINRKDELDRHTHIFIPNMTLTEDGKILTIDIKNLMKQQKLFGAMARAKLAAKLQREGIELEFDDLEKGIYRVKGISREIEEHFSQRSAEIIREQKKYGEKNAVATQIATLTTRKAKNHKVDLDKIFSTTCDYLQKSGVKIERQEKISPADMQEKKKIFSEVLTDIELKSFSFTRSEIVQKVLNAGLNAQIQVEDAEKFINRSQRLRQTTDANGEEIFISLANEKCEQDMLDLLQLGQGNGQAIDSLTADRLLEKVVTEKKYTPNQEQVTAILTALTSKNSYVATQGLAGVGKTYFVKILREICEKCDIPVMGAAFSGSAADELANDSGITNCNTIDSLLLKYENESLQNLHKPINTDFQFKRDYNFRGLKRDSKGGFLVVDEFGMVDDIHARALMQLCAAKGWKLLAIGDYDQIPAINVGDAHRFLIEHGATTCFLQNITRQRENLELLEVVKESVLGSVDKSFNLLGDKIQQIENRRQRQLATVEEYFSAMKKYSQEKIAVATLTNSERISTNELIRERLIQQGKLSKGKIFHISNGDAKSPVERDIEVSVGDRIICLKNDKRIGVRNGSRGKIIDIDKFGKITMQTDSGNIISFHSDSYNCFDLSYAMTLNKLQGATVQKIICNADSNSHFDRNKFYVAISRAKLEAVIFTDDKEKLQKDAQSWCHKVTSGDFIHNLQAQIENNRSRVVNSDYLSKSQRASLLQKKFCFQELLQHNRNLMREKYGTVNIDTLSYVPSPFYRVESQKDKSFAR